jgi:hypothetical protein
MGSQPTGAEAVVPGLLEAAKVAVWVPVVAESLTMIAEAPGIVPIKLNAADPTPPASNVSVTPVPPVLGASIVNSPVCAIENPNALREDVPTVESGAM